MNLKVLIKLFLFVAVAISVLDPGEEKYQVEVFEDLKLFIHTQGQLK